MDDPWRILGVLGADGAATGFWCAAKAAGVLAGAGLAAFALRRRSAATRHAAWGLGLAGALAVLPLSLALPRWGVPVLAAPAGGDGGRAPSPGPEVAPPPTAAREVVMQRPIAPAEAPAPARASGASSVGPDAAAGLRVPWPLAAWGAGTAAVLAWGLAGWASTLFLGRRARRVDDPRWVDGVREAADRLGMGRRRVTLLRGGPAAMPVTWGLLRPVLLLPEEADGWPDARRRAVLLHELAHVRRRDCLTQWLGLTTCAAYWFNPLAWWAASRLRAEREQACDDLVLEVGERPTDYAAELLGVARSLRPVKALALSPAAMAMARPSGLETRLLSILDPRRRRRGPARRLVVAGLALVLTASATLAAVRLVAKETPRPVLAGRVVGPDGKPLGGAADVAVVASRFRWQRRASDRMSAELLGRGRSDEKGGFRIELSGEPESDEGRVVVVATSGGLGFAAREVTDLDTKLDEPIRLRAEHPVEVRLVDLEGSPIAGAEVHLRSSYPAKGGTGLSAEFLKPELFPSLSQGRKSDRDGRLTVRGCGVGHNLYFSVRAPGFGKQQVQLDIKAGTGTSTLALGRAHVVEGRVTLGKDGPPATGVRIETRSMSEKYGIGMYLGGDEATTDAERRYRIEAAPGGSIVVQVHPTSRGEDAYLMRGKLVVPGDSVASRADFALPKGVLVRGRVVEAGTKRPVAGAVVYHEAHSRNNPYYIKGDDDYPRNADEQRAVTAADGTYRLGVMPGPGYLIVKGPTADYLHEEISGVELNGGLIWPNTRHYPDAYRKIAPKPDEGPVDAEFALRRGVTVRGRLVDEAGQPVREAGLASRWYLSSSGITVNHGAARKSLRGGRFELLGCDPASSAPVLFLDVKDQRGAVVEISGKQAGEDVVVTLKPCGTGRVRIVDGQGKPVRAGRAPAHLEVVLSPGASWGDMRFDDDKSSPLMADSVHYSNFDVGRYREIKTDAEGRLTFPTLIPGATYRIIVFNQKEKTEIEFTVKPGEVKDLGDLKIQNLQQAG